MISVIRPGARVHVGNDHNIEILIENILGVSSAALAESWVEYQASITPFTATVISKSSVGGGVSIELEGDLILLTIHLTPSDTIGLQPRKYYHEAMFFIGGKRFTVLSDYNLDIWPSKITAP